MCIKNHQNTEIFLCVWKMEPKEGYLYTNFEGFILIYDTMNTKNGFGLLLAVKKVEVTNCNSICHATDQMYILSFKLVSQSKWKKNSGKLGQTNRCTNIAKA